MNTPRETVEIDQDELRGIVNELDAQIQKDEDWWGQFTADGEFYSEPTDFGAAYRQARDILASFL